MHESFLPERARSAYRLSPWKKYLDDRAGTLLASGYSPKTIRVYLDCWVAFVAEYDAAAVLPTDVRGVEVATFLKARWSAHPSMQRCVRGALRHLLCGDGDLAQALTREREPDSAQFEEHIPGYLGFRRQHQGRRSSRSVERVLRDFFAWLAGGGFDDIADVGPGEIRDFLSSLCHLKRSTVAEYASVLRGFFRYLGMSGMVRPELAKVIESPRLYRMSAPPPVLDHDTVERLLSAVDRTTAIGKRNYAMLLLASRYGMRPCDIRTLRLDDIHWREQRIVLLQGKTQHALELPLIRDVDNALVDYLRNGRPTCDAREVFLRHVVPVAPFAKSQNLWDLMQRAFHAAGIQPPAGRHGLYLLRHSAATRMLGQGAPFNIIADVLGHASVETTRIYAQVDLGGLRSVALSAGEVWG